MAGPWGALIKAGVIGALIVALCLGLIAYGEHRKQQEWDVAIAKQAIKSAEQVIAEAENTAKIEVRYIKIKGATEIVHQIVEKEVIRYVEHPVESCVLTLEFERTFDTLSRLYDPRTERVPSPSSPTGDVAGSGPAPLTCVAVLRAYQFAVEQLVEQRNAYEAVVDWMRSDYEIQLTDVGRHRLAKD